MESVLLGLQSRLDEMNTTLLELKAENHVLRNEILGIGPSAESNVKRMGILENKTLREFVEEIQFDIKSIKTEMQNGTRRRDSSEQKKPEHSEPPQISVDNNENDVDDDMSIEEYAVAEIEHKTIEEHRAWMKLKFIEERAKLRDPVDGETLAGKTVKSMSYAIPISREAVCSCVLQLSNHLNFDLTDRQECTKRGRKLSGPTDDVKGHTREVFSFQGNEASTYFILSFRMRKHLRITIACWTLQNSEVALSVGFTPEGVPTADLGTALIQLKKAPDAYEGDMAHGRNITCKNETLEYFVIHGKLLARAHMSPGRRSVVHLEILEVRMPRTIRIPSTPNNLASLFQITNCLTVSLKNARRFDHKGEITVALPNEVLPCSREILFLSHTSRIVESIISYEIHSTDLGFVLAFRVEGNRNAFSAALVPVPAVTDKTNFDSAMDPGQWKSHVYRKYANAEDGEQVIQIRNIRAEVSMTAEEKPQFRIRIFAV